MNERHVAELRLSPQAPKLNSCSRLRFRRLDRPGQYRNRRGPAHEAKRKAHRPEARREACFKEDRRHRHQFPARRENSEKPADDRRPGNSERFGHRHRDRTDGRV